MNDVGKVNLEKFKFRKNVNFPAKDIVNCKVLCFGRNFVCVGVSLTEEEEIL